MTNSDISVGYHAPLVPESFNREPQRQSVRVCGREREGEKRGVGALKMIILEFPRRGVKLNGELWAMVWPN